MFHAKFENFSAIIFLSTFLSLPFFPSFCDYGDMHVKSFVIVSWVSEALLILYLPLLKLGNLFCSSSLSLTFVPFILCWAHSMSCLFLLSYFSILKFPFGSSLHLLFLCWNFLFFSFASNMLATAHWSIFTVAALKSLSDN